MASHVYVLFKIGVEGDHGTPRAPRLLDFAKQISPFYNLEEEEDLISGHILHGSIAGPQYALPS